MQTRITTAKARALGYLSQMPPAIAGHGRHSATFAAACRLVEFGLSEADTWELLCEWNSTHCQPPWTVRELHHKLADARQTASLKPELTGISHRQKWSERPQLDRTTTCPRQNSKNTADTHTKRPLWNPAASIFGTATSQSHFQTLATLRCLSVDGVRLAHERGLLRFGTWHSELAWFILDGSQRVAQARRLDGQPWKEGAKAWTLPGSQAAWPVGIGEGAAQPAIALCEGGPDLIAVCAFIQAEGRERDVAPVAMLAGKASIHEAALPMFTGKRVRIFAHLDETGTEAANRWGEQLAAAGATVDVFSFATLRRTDCQPVKDLCDLAAVHADDFEAFRCLWELFDHANEE